MPSRLCGTWGAARPQGRACHVRWPTLPIFLPEEAGPHAPSWAWASRKASPSLPVVVFRGIHYRIVSGFPDRMGATNGAAGSGLRGVGGASKPSGMSATASDARARRNVAVLVAAQAILGAQMPMIFTIGGLAGQSLAPNPCWATMPISMIVLGSMLSATPISALMQRFGRRFGFVLGAAGGAVGAAVGAWGLYTGSFVTFLAGSLDHRHLHVGAGLHAVRRRRHGVGRVPAEGDQLRDGGGPCLGDHRAAARQGDGGCDGGAVPWHLPCRDRGERGRVVPVPRASTSRSRRRRWRARPRDGRGGSCWPRPGSRSR